MFRIMEVCQKLSATFILEKGVSNFSKIKVADNF